MDSLSIQNPTLAPTAATLAPVPISQDVMQTIQKSIAPTPGQNSASVPMSGIERTIISIAIALMIMSIFVVLFYQKPGPVDPLGL